MTGFDQDAGIRAATALLLRQRLHNLAIDVMKLRYDKEIHFRSMQNFCATTRTTMEELNRSSDTRDGLTLRRKRGDGQLYLVLYNEAAGSLRRRNFTLAHEIGHIYLEHADDGDEQERQANSFAAQLLLPGILVERLIRQGPLTAGDLCDIFFVSRQAAENRLRNMVGDLGYTDGDRALLDRFGGLLPNLTGPVVTI